MAISMALLVIGFSAISGRTADVQFTDSMRTIESQLRRNLSNVGFGLNLRGDLDCQDVGGGLDFPAGDDSPMYPEPGKNMNCVANGVLLSFSSEESFTVSAVASRDEMNDDDSSLEDLEHKLENDLTAEIPNTAQDITYNWQTRFIGAFDSDGTEVDMIEFLRMRVLEGSMEYLFVRTNTADSFENGLVTGDQEYEVCFEGVNGSRASIIVGAEARFQADLSRIDNRCNDL